MASNSNHAPEPCVVVIFGASGDLTHRKLIPAIYNIAAAGDLPPQFKVVGFARRDKTDEGFRAELETGNRKNSRQGHNDELWSSTSWMLPIDGGSMSIFTRVPPFVKSSTQPSQPPIWQPRWPSITDCRRDSSSIDLRYDLSSTKANVYPHLAMAV